MPRHVSNTVINCADHLVYFHSVRAKERHSSMASKGNVSDKGGLRVTTNLCVHNCNNNTGRPTMYIKIFVRNLAFKYSYVRTVLKQPLHDACMMSDQPPGFNTCSMPKSPGARLTRASKRQSANPAAVRLSQQQRAQTGVQRQQVHARHPRLMARQRTALHTVTVTYNSHTGKLCIQTCLCNHHVCATNSTSFASCSSPDAVCSVAAASASFAEKIDPAITPDAPGVARNRQSIHSRNIQLGSISLSGRACAFGAAAMTSARSEPALQPEAVLRALRKRNCIHASTHTKHHSRCVLNIFSPCKPCCLPLSW
jgi:hypothetical protein